MIKVGLIGAGQWGMNLLRTFHRLERLGGVAEADPSIRERIRQEFPGVPVYEDYKALYKQPDIPAVAIATPAHTHYAIVKEALEAGKDVFVEKPFTLSTEEAVQLDELAQHKGQLLMVGHLLLYQPAIQAIKAYLESGKLGRIISLHQQRLKLGRVRQVENVLWSFGVHDIAVLLFLIGEEPKEVVATGQRFLQPSVEDDVYLHLTFPNGVSAHLHTSWLWPTTIRKLTIIGTNGTLEYDELKNKVVLYRKGIDASLQPWDQGEEIIFEGSGEPLREELLHFIQCVETRTIPFSSSRQGVAVVRILEAASQQLTAESGGQT